MFREAHFDVFTHDILQSKYWRESDCHTLVIDLWNKTLYKLINWFDLFGQNGIDTEHPLPGKIDKPCIVHHFIACNLINS